MYGSVKTVAFQDQILGVDLGVDANIPVAPGHLNSSRPMCTPLYRANLP